MLEYLSAETFRELIKFVKGVMDNKKDARLLEARAELLGKIIDIQANYMELRQENEDLKRQLRAKSEWEKERQNYELEEVRAGAFVYTRKIEANNGDPKHQICPHCFEQEEKSILQCISREQRRKHLICHRCGYDIDLTR